MDKFSGRLCRRSAEIAATSLASLRTNYLCIYGFIVLSWPRRCKKWPKTYGVRYNHCIVSILHCAPKISQVKLILSGDRYRPRLVPGPAHLSCYASSLRKTPLISAVGCSTFAVPRSTAGQASCHRELLKKKRRYLWKILLEFIFDWSQSRRGCSRFYKDRLSWMPWWYTSENM